MNDRDIQAAPETIYLLDMGDDGLVWCKDPNPDELDRKPVKYVRADTIQSTAPVQDAGDLDGLVRVLNHARCHEGRTVGNYELAKRIIDHLAPRLARQSEYVTPPEFERAFEKHHIGCLDGVSTPKTVQPDDARKALEDFDAQINALRYVLNIANSDPNKRIGTVINSTFRERDDGSMVTTLLDLENLWTNRKTIERALSQQSVPDWWKLVPIEPTPDMQGSGESSFLKAKGWASHHAVPAIYKAILSAAPQPPAAEDKS